MSDPKPFIAELQLRLLDEEAKVVAAQAAVTKTKIGINVLCDLAGDPPMYPDVNASPIPTSTISGVGIVTKADQYFNRPLATCVREVLEQRKKMNLGPATLAEIHAVLKAGSYAFESRDDENAIRGLGVSVSKNTSLFVRLPNGLVGLAEWYGVSAKRKAKGKENDEVDADSSVEAPAAPEVQNQSKEDEL
jgi:hypothetical protein